MIRLRRTPLVLFLIALHLGVTFGGSGLHALPGLGHGAEFQVAKRNDHSHGPGKSSHTLADECSICQFFNEDGVAADAPVLATVTLAAGESVVLASTTFGRACCRVDSCRAPPSRFAV